jgi:hypothetical protein
MIKFMKVYYIIEHHMLIIELLGETCERFILLNRMTTKSGNRRVFISIFLRILKTETP